MSDPSVPVFTLPTASATPAQILADLCAWEDSGEGGYPNTLVLPEKMSEQLTDNASTDTSIWAGGWQVVCTPYAESDPHGTVYHRSLRADR